MNFKFKNLFVKGIKKDKNAPIKAKQKRTIFTRVRTRSHSINGTGDPAQQGSSRLAWARPSSASQNHMNKHQLNQEKRQRNRAENIETELRIWQESLYGRVGITIVGKSLSNHSLGNSDPATEKQDMVREEHTPVTLAAERAVVSSRASCMNRVQVQPGLCETLSQEQNRSRFYRNFKSLEAGRYHSWQSVCLASWDPWQPCKELGKAKQACNPGFAGSQQS